MAKTKKTSEFKKYLKSIGITQDDLANMTYLSVKTVNKLVNTGIANKSVVLLISYVLGINEQELNEMLKIEKQKAPRKK
jgi:transcriptional regulator with XRE-family HTH domain